MYEVEGSLSAIFSGYEPRWIETKCCSILVEIASRSLW